MTKNKSTKKKQKKYIGIFSRDNDNSIIGDLSLDGPDTTIELHSDKKLAPSFDFETVEGTAYSGEHITLIDCICTNTSHNIIRDQITTYNMNLFPHFISIGNRHLKPETPYITSISFSTTDLETIFYDFDAFGNIGFSPDIIDHVLEDLRKTRPVESGEYPVISYYTGKSRIVEVSTDIGKISVHHRPSYNMGGPAGVYIKNRIVVSIAPDSMITFDDAIDRMHQVSNFLSIAAGRSQGISNIEIRTHEQSDLPDLHGLHDFPLSITASLARKVSKKNNHLKPHPGDVPLNPIERTSEFQSVLSNWIKRNSGWRTARTRYLECLRKGNKFGPDRLVAAANMFDILPLDAVPLITQLSDEMSATRDSCRALFKALPNGIDRNSALDALGRLGKPSLPKKVLHRTSMVTEQIGEAFPELELVASVAVKCRNYFVHGSSGDIDFLKVEHLIPFLTNTLEFIFASSDFIEAGWNSKLWIAEFCGGGHSFTRYRIEYRTALERLKYAIA